MAFVDPSLNLQTLLLAKRETEQGVENVPDTTNDVINFHTESNPVGLDARRITVQDITGSFTKSKDVIGRKLNPVTFQVHMGGVGDAGSDIEPRWVRLLEACGHSTASGNSGGSSSWVLTPDSTAVQSLTFFEYTAKTRKDVVGALGTASLVFPAGDAPNGTFNFMGEYQTPTSESAFPTSITRQTKSVKLVQSMGLVIGSYTPRAQSISLDFAEAVNERPDVNSAEGLYGLFIGDRNPVVTIDLEAEEDQPAVDLGSSVSLWDALEDETTQNISWTYSAVANNFTTLYSLNGMQLVNKQFRDVNRNRVLTTTWKAQNDTANGEYTITHTERHG